MLDACLIVVVELGPIEVEAVVVELGPIEVEAVVVKGLAVDGSITFFSCIPEFTICNKTKTITTKTMATIIHTKFFIDRPPFLPHSFHDSIWVQIINPFL